MSAPRHYTLQGFSPTGFGIHEFRIPNAIVQHCQRYFPPYKFHELRLVKEIIERPTAIFEGLREEQEDGLCYAGVPSCRYTNAGTSKAVGSRWTFLVFMRANLEIFAWRFEEADRDREGFPINHDTRFESQKWPKT